MNILTEQNYDCSFMQTIIRLPQTVQDLTFTAGIPPYIVEKLDDYEGFTREVMLKYKRCKALTAFLRDCLDQKQVYYVKNFPEGKAGNRTTEIRHFICYGEYHRNLAPEKKQNLFFRLDQRWDDYQFPQFSDPSVTAFFKEHLPYLSGLHSVETIFPPLMHEQGDLGKMDDFLAAFTPAREDFISDHLMDHLFCFSSDYFSNHYFLDQSGSLLEFNFDAGQLRKSDKTFFKWVWDEMNTLV